jgi:RNA polymerase sigma-70 factor (ECF subfamily)
MQARMKNPALMVPEAMTALQAFGASIHQSNLSPKTLELVHLRASQINGCSVCVDGHARIARKAGETDERLFAVAAWRDAPYFSDAERAALDLTEAVTRVADGHVPEPVADQDTTDAEAMMADSVGAALLVVLETLAPAERLAFVLHDMFAMSFDDIAPVVGRSVVATRQLASRARRRVQGGVPADDADLQRDRKVVDAFLAASRNGDFAALLEVLDPDIVFRADPVAVRMGSLAEIHGAAAVAEVFKGRAQAAKTALVDGAMGVAVIFGGQLRIVLAVTIEGGKISEINAIADPDGIKAFEVVPLEV